MFRITHTHTHTQSKTLKLLFFRISGKKTGISSEKLFADSVQLSLLLNKIKSEKGNEVPRESGFFQHLNWFHWINIVNIKRTILKTNFQMVKYKKKTNENVLFPGVRDEKADLYVCMCLCVLCIALPYYNIIFNLRSETFEYTEMVFFFYRQCTMYVHHPYIHTNELNNNILNLGSSSSKSLFFSFFLFRRNEIFIDKCTYA